jgi:putative membrane protein
MIIRTTLFAIALGSTSLVAAEPINSDTAKLTELDAQVIAHLHAVDRLEIDLGKLAQANGTAPVKTYGQMLVKDHTAFDAKVVAFAKTHGVTTIPDDESMSAADKADMDTEKGKLEALKGAAFDQELLPMMASAHDKELTKADANIAVVTDRDLKTMLQALKPTLQKHADSARKLESPAVRSSTPTAR